MKKNDRVRWVDTDGKSHEGIVIETIRTKREKIAEIEERIIHRISAKYADVIK